MQGPRSSLQRDLQSKVNKLQFDIEEKDQEVAQRDQGLKRAEQERATIAQGFATIRNKIQNAQRTIAKLLQEKSDLENTLTLREVEFKALRRGVTAEMEQQHHVMSLKEKEILDLRKQLQTVTEELQKTEPQVKTMHRELQSISIKLERKTTEVQMLRESKEELKLQLEMERKRIDGYLIQQTAAKDSDASYRRQVEVSTNSIIL